MAAVVLPDATLPDLCMGERFALLLQLDPPVAGYFTGKTIVVHVDSPGGTRRTLSGADVTIAGDGNSATVAKEPAWSAGFSELTAAAPSGIYDVHVVVGGSTDRDKWAYFTMNVYRPKGGSL